MKGGWRGAAVSTALLIACIFAATPVSASAIDDPVQGLSPYKAGGAWISDPGLGPDADLEIAAILPDRLPIATLGGGLQVSLLFSWTHFGYGGELKPRGYGAGLRFDIGWSQTVSIFLEGRVTRGEAEETIPADRKTDVLFDAANAILGISILLPGSNLTASDEEVSEALFFHQIEIGACGQQYEADQDAFSIPLGIKIVNRNVDENGVGGTIRYRVGSQVGEGWYFSFTGGVDVLRRQQFPIQTSPPWTDGPDRWDIDVTFTVVLGVDF
ncbi:MAG TPA: hypothetical protein VI643_00680 [Planctomycetota bacterium]|nr:hypothetical protein [Planctomycetota bacterium]